MNSNSLYATCLRSTIHFMMKITFGDIENSHVLIRFIKHSQQIFNFITQKIRQIYDSVSFFRLRRHYFLFSMNYLKLLIDHHLPIFKIKVRRSKCKQFRNTDSCPVKDFKRIIGNRFCFHFLGKSQILILRPKKHFSCIGFSYLFAPLTWILRQAIISYCMIEDC